MLAVAAQAQLNGHAGLGGGYGGYVRWILYPFAFVRWRPRQLYDAVISINAAPVDVAVPALTDCAALLTASTSQPALAIRL